jgi:hypothetical protein
MIAPGTTTRPSSRRPTAPRRLYRSAGRMSKRWSMVISAALPRRDRDPSNVVSPARIAPPCLERGGLRGDDQETRQDAGPQPGTQAEQTHNRHVTVMPQIHMADTRSIRVRVARGRAAVPSPQSRPLRGRSTPRRPQRAVEVVVGPRRPTTAVLAQRLDQLAGGADEEALGHR